MGRWEGKVYGLMERCYFNKWNGLTAEWREIFFLNGGGGWGKGVEGGICPV